MSDDFDYPDISPAERRAMFIDAQLARLPRNVDPLAADAQERERKAVERCNAHFDALERRPLSDRLGLGGSDMRIHWWEVGDDGAE